MLRSRLVAVTGLACALALTACGPQPQDRPFQTTIVPATAEPAAPPAEAYPIPVDPATGGYPSPDATVAAGAPLDDSYEGRDQTALASYQIALEYAQQEFGPVQLYAIIPSHIMLANLGNPPVEPGWFYKFQGESDPAFHFVQVVDGIVIGARSLTPLGEDEPQEPIDMAAVTVDSDAVFEKFRQRAPELGITVDETLVYDLELVQLQGSPAPIWSVVTPDGSQWLFSVNAVTGEETEDPRK